VAETAAGNGVLSLSIGDALALFGDASVAPAGGDAASLAAAAGAAVRRATGREVAVLYARQEHTRLAFTFSSEAPLPAAPHLVGTCDALLTAQPWVALTVRTADCLPVALAGGGAVAIVHAGWRGLGADILGAVVERMRLEFGVGAGQLGAAVGVGIGPCHYPVGGDVIEALARHGVAADWRRGDGAVSLAEWARGRLTALGVPAAAVRVLPGCTACSPRHHSFRRDGARAGRQWSTLVLAGALRSDRR